MGPVVPRNRPRACGWREKNFHEGKRRVWKRSRITKFTGCPKRSGAMHDLWRPLLASPSVSTSSTLYGKPLRRIRKGMEMPDFTDDKRHDSLDGHCAEGCPCLLDERPGIFSSWGEAFQVLGGITALMISFALMICELVRIICKLVRLWP